MLRQQRWQIIGARGRCVYIVIIMYARAYSLFIQA